MSEFQLIILAGVARPAREVPLPGEFSLIPFRTEARMAAAEQQQQTITATDLASWWTPLTAVAYAMRCKGIVSAEKASQAIWQRLIAGQIETASTTSSTAVDNRSPVVYSSPRLIPRGFWQYLTNIGSDLWGAGDARFFDNSGTHRLTHHCFGIRLNPADIRATLPDLRPPDDPQPTEAAPAKPVEAASQPESQVSRGGRPRKEWWDDFWIDICGQIYEGNLKPKRQADLERAMLDWATNHGHDMSEATAKKVAKKLFVAWKLGG